jgi:hypothetical protein
VKRLIMLGEQTSVFCRFSCGGLAGALGTAV